MSAALDRGTPLLAGCLTAVSVRGDAHSGGLTVEVWRADLDAAPGELVDLLSPQERTRATRIVQSAARARWVSSRGVLRALLGCHLECDPRHLRFQLGPHGKPALPGGELSFNVSHSEGVALYALAPTAVGVDVEVLAPRPPSRDELALAERALGPDVARRLRALTPSARHREFLRQWVRHEATLKCLGVGLLDSSAAAAGPPAWPVAAAGPAAQVATPAAGLRVSILDVGPHAIAALAVQSASPQATPVGASRSDSPPSVR
jgi:4'-phosphopantetheinyl transferase